MTQFEAAFSRLVQQEIYMKQQISRTTGILLLLWLGCFLAATSNGSPIFSTGAVTACDYGQLGPGGSFQSVADPFGLAPCDTSFTMNGSALGAASATIHPGLSGESGAPRAALAAQCQVITTVGLMPSGITGVAQKQRVSSVTTSLTGPLDYLIVAAWRLSMFQPTRRQAMTNSRAGTMLVILCA
jgi:hypothetical protein